MVQCLTIQQQINALEKSIRLEQYRYTLALEEGQPNSCLEMIGDNISKLAMILKCVNSIHEEKKLKIVLTQPEIVDNYNQNIEAEKLTVF